MRKGEAEPREVVLDCEDGRALGCATYCCRLIVRLGPDDEPAYDAEGRRKNCVDKEPATGLCVHLDEATHRCEIWAQRPMVCRGFDCNADPLLPVVLAEGFVSLTQLVRASTRRSVDRPAARVPMKLHPDGA